MSSRNEETIYSIEGEINTDEAIKKLISNVTLNDEDRLS
jgi:hypothetical protein